MYWVLIGVSKTLQMIPEPILEKMGVVMGWFLFEVLRLRRSLIVQNIQTAFPDLSGTEVRKMGRASVQSLAMTVLEILWSWKQDLSKRVEIKNAHLIRDALSEGRGLYFLCTHTGNFQAFGMKISMEFVPVLIPAKRVGRNEGVHRYVSENRKDQHIDSLFREKKGEGFSAIQRVLSEKRIVGFMLDQARPGEPRLPFFGKLAKTNTSLGAIWEKCPAPMVAGYCERVGFARHVIHVFSTGRWQSTGNLERDVLDRAVTCNKIAEEIVKACPHQYWWIHNRWK